LVELELTTGVANKFAERFVTGPTGGVTQPEVAAKVATTPVPETVKPVGKVTVMLPPLPTLVNDAISLPAAPTLGTGAQ